MHTQGHAILNVTLLGKRADRDRNIAILTGAILPDTTIFLFYLYHRFAMGLSNEVIWRQAYFAPGPWQDLIDGFHSIPFALLGSLVISALSKVIGETRAAVGQAFFASAFLHSISDLVLHHDDAHRHFFPFFDWRWKSPVSYWDPRHYGVAAYVTEAIVIVVASVVLWRRGVSRTSQGFILAANALYLLPLLSGLYSWM